MPASGFTPFLLYASSTPGAAPTAPNMVNGAGSELAINIADGKLYYKDSSGVVQVLATKSAAAQQFSAIAVTGGTINGTSVGATTPSTGAFTTLSSTGTTALGATSAASINSTPIGATTPSTGAFAGLSATGTINFTGGTTTVANSAAATAQPVPRSQADTLYQTYSGPAFSAYGSAGTAVAANTFTKIALQAKSFDTANAFDNTTNYRFQPQVAGYYQLTGALSAGISPAASTTVFNAAIYKNGALAANGTFINGPTLSQTTSVASTILYLNGSTDYVELWCFSSSALTTSAGSQYAYLCGSLARGA